VAERESVTVVNRWRSFWKRVPSEIYRGKSPQRGSIWFDQR